LANSSASSAVTSVATVTANGQLFMFIFIILYYGNKITIIVLYYPQNISEKISGFNRGA
jgi:uncharacterized membrane protein